MRKLTATVLVLTILCTGVSAPAHAEGGTDRMKAFLLSFAVPGLGQWYAGSPGYAKLFAASELAILGGYYYNIKMKSVSRNDYYSQAAIHAGLNPRGRGSDVLNALGGFNSSYEYNRNQLMSSDSPVIYTGADSWEWDAETNRLLFKNYRERELEYKNRIKLFIAGIVLNHFLAGLNASRIAQNNGETVSAVGVQLLPDGLHASYTRSF